jgi:hypothetical protein
MSLTYLHWAKRTMGLRESGGLPPRLVVLSATAAAGATATAAVGVTATAAGGVTATFCCCF